MEAVLSFTTSERGGFFEAVVREADGEPETVIAFTAIEESEVEE